MCLNLNWSLSTRPCSEDIRASERVLQAWASGIAYPVNEEGLALDLNTEKLPDTPPTPTETNPDQR